MTRAVRRILNVAEKNDAAKNITNLLSRGQFNRREGFSQYNKIYEFSYHLFGANCAMVFTSVSGHVMGLDFEVENRNWKSTPIDRLFNANVVKSCSKNMMNILKTLKCEARKSDLLIIWTDCDREGENIGFEIIDTCKSVSATLDVRRAIFSEITAPAVTRALNHLAYPDKRLSDAVDCRMEMDLRTGAAFTRFQTLRLQNVFPDLLKEKLISYGSCQFPTLGFVVDRYKQNKNFICEPFWKLLAVDVGAEASNCKTEFNWSRGRLFDKSACETLLAVCLEHPRVANVLSVTKKPTTKRRPLPLETVALEKLVSRKLRISAKETMTLAEKLYTQGYISYPRTETNSFAKEINLAQLVQLQVNDSQWGAFASAVLQHGPNPRNGTKNDHAHPPIHPIRYAAPQELNGNHKRVYEFIVRHFLACLSQDAEGFQTTVNIDVREERFYANGLLVTARNYLDVYPYENWTSKAIGEYVVGQQFAVDVKMCEGNTAPPTLLSEADLIALMDKFGIGTDATHAEHIETIKSRLYVGLTNEARFVPGYLGLGLVEGYDLIGCQMAKPNLRAEFESDLKKICQGETTKETVLRLYIEKYKQMYHQVIGSANCLDSSLSVYFLNGRQPLADVQSALANSSMALGDQSNGAFVADFGQQCSKCTSCNSAMNLKTTRNNKVFLGCSAYPSCKQAVWIDNGEVISGYSVTDQRCPQCRGRDSRIVQFTFKPNSVGLPSTAGVCLTCPSDLASKLGVKLPYSANASSSTSSAQSTAPTCHCGVLCALQTRQDNTNRQFYDCPLKACNFFSWSTDGQVQRGPVAAAEENPMMCNCGLQCTLLTVRKENANKGRKFYVCPKRQGEQGRCNFFLWADAAAPTEALNTHTSSTPRISVPPVQGANASLFFPTATVKRGSATRGRSSGPSGGRTRRCGICRQQGHTAKNCVNRRVP